MWDMTYRAQKRAIAHQTVEGKHVSPYHRKL